MVLLLLEGSQSALDENKKWSFKKLCAGRGGFLLHRTKEKIPNLEIWPGVEKMHMRLYVIW